MAVRQLRKRFDLQVRSRHATYLCCSVCARRREMGEPAVPVRSWAVDR
jgi:hypothetical protein